MRIFLGAISLAVVFGATSLARAESASVAGARAEALAKIESGALVVDVRTPEEFATGHLARATNVPHTAIAKNLATFGTDKEREIVLYCRSGRRAGLATAELRALGYTSVYNAGGYAELAAAAP